MTLTPVAVLLLIFAGGIAAGLIIVRAEPFVRRDWLVIETDGVIFAVHEGRLTSADTVIRGGLTFHQAQRLARRLRLKAEDTPRPLF